MNAVAGARKRLGSASRPVWAVPVLLYCLALALRLSTNVALPGADERITIEMVRRFGFVEMLWSIPRVQPHFPLYYMLLDAWSAVAPVRTARWLSIVAGAAVPVVAYAWFRQLVGEPRATVVGLLLACSPTMAVQSRWLRMYALLALAVLVSWWAAWRWLSGNGRGASYVVVAIATVGLHPFGIAVVVAQLAWLAVEQYMTSWRPWFRPAVVAVSAVAISATLWLFARLADVSGTGTIDPGHMHIQYATVPVQRAVVLPITALTGTVHGPVYPATLSIVLALGYWTCQTRFWHSRHCRMAVAWVGASLAVLYIGHAIRPVLLLKYLAWLAPAVALWAVSVVPLTYTGRGVLSLLAGVMGWNLLHGLVIHANVGMVAIWGSGVVDPGAI